MRCDTSRSLPPCIREKGRKITEAFEIEQAPGLRPKHVLPPGSLPLHESENRARAQRPDLVDQRLSRVPCLDRFEPATELNPVSDHDRNSSRFGHVMWCGT